MTIKLQPGDYVKLRELTDDQYHAVAKAFIDAGASPGEYPHEDRNCWEFFGWYDGPSQLVKRGMAHWDNSERFSRVLTIDKILGYEPTLPAIGTKWIECEDGDVVEVVAHHNGAVVCWSEGEGYRSYDMSELKEISELGQLEYELRDHSHTPFAVAEYLFNLGYRKQ